MKCKHCCKDCPWRDEATDECWYEPDDYNGKDIGSATADEVKKQNGNY